jgi:uncharacterized protein (DUF1330 family)
VTAYWINFVTRISDPDRVAAYAALAGPVMRAAGASSSPAVSRRTRSRADAPAARP